MDGIGDEGLAHLEGQTFRIDLRTTAEILRSAQDDRRLILSHTFKAMCAIQKAERNEDFRVAPGACYLVPNSGPGNFGSLQEISSNGLPRVLQFSARFTF
jgi:hypothetical protein